MVVPQEAYIGIVYVVFAAASILVLSRAPEGGEELKSLLVGHLLFAEWSEILKTLILYSCVATLHWFMRDRFWAVSNSYEDAQAAVLRFERGRVGALLRADDGGRGLR